MLSITNPRRKRKIRARRKKRIKNLKRRQIKRRSVVIVGKRNLLNAIEINRPPNQGQDLNSEKDPEAKIIREKGMSQNAGVLVDLKGEAQASREIEKTSIEITEMIEIAVEILEESLEVQ